MEVTNGKERYVVKESKRLINNYLGGQIIS